MESTYIGKKVSFIASEPGFSWSLSRNSSMGANSSP
jgi:hypothetical protein